MDPQLASGFRLGPFTKAKLFRQEPSLEVLDNEFQDVLHILRMSRTPHPIAENMRWDVASGNALLVLQSNGHLDHILKFPDVSAPGMPLQDGHGLRRYAKNRTPRLRVILSKKCLHSAGISSGRSLSGGISIRTTLSR